MRAISRLIAVLSLTISITVFGHASDPSGFEIVGTFDLSQLPAGSRNSSAVLIAFVSETSIAVGLCANKPTGCALSLLRRDGVDLRPVASTPHFRGGNAMHVSSDGKILITQYENNPAMLFSQDLTAIQELPGIFLVLQSGNTGAALMKGGWKLYRIQSNVEFVREGKGSLHSLSDDVVVFQDGNLMRVESLQGAPLGAFHVESGSKCFNLAYPLSTSTLYLDVDDCKKIRIVNFEGKRLAELQPPRGWRASQSWSSDGTRILFDNFDRKVSGIRKVGEGVLALGTLGAGVADQKDNREEVMVLDANTGNSCFDWKRSFRIDTASLTQDAAISPSGRFVAIAADGTLRLYRLPQVCTGSR